MKNGIIMNKRPSYRHLTPLNTHSARVALRTAISSQHNLTVVIFRIVILSVGRFSSDFSRLPRARIFFAYIHTLACARTHAREFRDFWGAPTRARVAAGLWQFWHPSRARATSLNPANFEFFEALRARGD